MTDDIFHVTSSNQQGGVTAGKINDNSPKKDSFFYSLVKRFILPLIVTVAAGLIIYYFTN